MVPDPASLSELRGLDPASLSELRSLTPALLSELPPTTHSGSNLAISHRHVVKALQMGARMQLCLQSTWEAAAGPATHTGEPGAALGFWLRPGPVPAAAAVSGKNQQKGTGSLCNTCPS